MSVFKKDNLHRKILTLLNDPQGKVWSEEQLDHFIDEAENMIPRLAASLMAQSRGMFEGAARLAAWPGLPNQHKPLTDAEVTELATVFRDIFTKEMTFVTPMGRLRMAESQIRAIENWNAPSQSLNRIDELLKDEENANLSPQEEPKVADGG